MHQHQNGVNGSSGKALAEHEKELQAALAEQFDEGESKVENILESGVGLCQTENCNLLECRENFCAADHFIR